MRSAGLSVWRLLAPAAFIAALSGIVIITLLDPISSNMLAYAEIMKSEKQGKERNLVRVFNDGIWLRQRDEGGQILINAAALDQSRTHLERVTVWRFNPEGVFQERIDAPKAALDGRTLELQDAKLNSIAEQEPIDLPVYAIMTALSAEDLRERVTPPETMSLWQLPHFIQLANSAGLRPPRYPDPVSRPQLNASEAPGHGSNRRRLFHAASPDGRVLHLDHFLDRRGFPPLYFVGGLHCAGRVGTCPCRACRVDARRHRHHRGGDRIIAP